MEREEVLSLLKELISGWITKDFQGMTEDTRLKEDLGLSEDSISAILVEFENMQEGPDGDTVIEEENLFKEGANLRNMIDNIMEAFDWD